MNIQIPKELSDKISQSLSSDDKWIRVGSQLCLLSASDINFYRKYPQKGGNGRLVLALWYHSQKDWKKFARVLQSDAVCLQSLAEELEAFVSYKQGLSCVVCSVMEWL